MFASAVLAVQLLIVPAIEDDHVIEDAASPAACHQVVDTVSSAVCHAPISGAAHLTAYRQDVTDQALPAAHHVAAIATYYEDALRWLHFPYH